MAASRRRCKPRLIRYQGIYFSKIPIEVEILWANFFFFVCMCLRPARMCCCLNTCQMFGEILRVWMVLFIYTLFFGCATHFTENWKWTLTRTLQETWQYRYSLLVLRCLFYFTQLHGGFGVTQDIVLMFVEEKNVFLFIQKYNFCAKLS